MSDGISSDAWKKAVIDRLPLFEALRDVEREAMPYDVVIIGAGPAGLSAAIRLKQLALAKGREVSVAVLEKSAEVGGHVIAGAVIDPRALDELTPDWKAQGAPLDTAVSKDEFLLLGPRGRLSLPMFALPPLMHNRGCYIGSLGDLTRWLAGQAEALGVEIYTGMAASELIWNDATGCLEGVVAGVFGVDRDGRASAGFEPGVEVRAKYLLIAEGARGSLAKAIIARHDLGRDADPQLYGLGIKELWQVPAEQHQPGLVQHTTGWPLDMRTGGGSFVYHFGDRYVSVGYVVHLDYRNPYLSPFDEFQRFKHHPAIASQLAGGTRLAYGARAITEGGLQSTPRLVFPGGALIGCAAGFVNVPRIKGVHNAMESGMLAADAVIDAIMKGRTGDELETYQSAWGQSRIHAELARVRNAKPLLSRFGTVLGGFLGVFDMWFQTLFANRSLFGTMRHGHTDAGATEPAAKHRPIEYPKPDGKLSFDKASSVYLSNTNHREGQPIHLRLLDPDVPVSSNLPIYGEPARLYCPAGVYEVLYDAEGGNPRFQINAQNCVHCKTCDIKDPSQNIVWTAPEGGGGPNYRSM